MTLSAAGQAPRLAVRKAALSRLQRALGPVRVRLAGLVFIAVIPLLLLSATIAWQNFRIAIDESAEKVVRLRESAIARHEAAVGGSEQMMQALSQVAELVTGDSTVCRAHLQGVLSLQRSRYSNVAMFDRAGHMLCSAAELPAVLPVSLLEQHNAPLFGDAARTHLFTLGRVRQSPLVGGPIIPAVYPVRDGQVIRGFLYAGIRVDWFENAQHRPAPGIDTPDLDAVWLADGSGALTQVAVTGDAALPQAPVLQALLERPRVINGAASGGMPYAYASAVLSGGYRLLVAYPSAADMTAAHRLLSKRILQLALLLLLGLAAVAVGAHLALVEPLDQLGRAVARWQRGGGFDPASIDDPPTEIRALATSFAQATQALADHEIRQRAAVEKQNLLMREIHHRVKNNLQIVASLLNLQASRIRQPEARAEFASARDRVRALATLHRHLYAEGEMHSIAMRSFLVELCGQLFQAMGEREGRRIKLGIEASDVQMSSDQAVPLALIITEAVSNALKYAFPHGREGHVDVIFTSDGETAELVIRDDGIGIPTGRAETEMGPRDGIGITLIRGFARQLGADLTVEENPGTLYRLCLTLRPSDLSEVALME